jgi:type I restriction enzyme, S subunit
MNITHERFAQLLVPLAPRQEQQRIADKLDTVLARVDACRDRLARVAPLLKRFRQSVLAAATSGRLTEDWRTSIDTQPGAPSLVESPGPLGADELPLGWRWVSMADLSTKISDGVHKKPNYVASGVPFLTVKNITAGPGISFEQTSFVTESDHEEFCRRTRPERDDILISKDGTLGVVRLIDTDRVFSIFVSLALVKLKDRRLSKYMIYALQAPVMQAQMAGVGTGLQHIHLIDLRSDLAPVPPLPEQEEVVRRVESLFAFADRLEARLARAQTAVDRLTPSLLAKAFRGELLPQDPADEPATELLKRLAASRTAPAAKTRKPRQGQPA